MQIDPFTLQSDVDEDWESVREKPTLARLREALAIRRLRAMRNLRGADPEMALSIKGRLSELEELLDLTDGDKHTNM